MALILNIKCNSEQAMMKLSKDLEAALSNMTDPVHIEPLQSDAFTLCIGRGDLYNDIEYDIHSSNMLLRNLSPLPKKYETKCVVIEALPWTGLNLKEIKEFVGDALTYDIIDDAWEVGKGRPHVNMQIKTLEGYMKVSVGDYIIKGLNGEFYPCKPDIFEKKYEAIRFSIDGGKKHD